MDCTTSRTDRVPHVRCVDSLEQCSSDNPGAEIFFRYAPDRYFRKLRKSRKAALRPPIWTFPISSSPNMGSYLSGNGSDLQLGTGITYFGLMVIFCFILLVRIFDHSSRLRNLRTMPLDGYSLSIILSLAHKLLTATSLSNVQRSPVSSKV